RANWIQIHSAALLKISELRDLKPIEHHLPSHAPCPARRPLPIVFLKLQIMLLEIDADCFERFEVKFLHIRRRRLQNELELRVLEQPIGILSIAAISRPARGLRITN